MKGYRRLAPHETTRPTDVSLSGGSPHELEEDTGWDAEEWGTDIYRKARTKGCPPGYRWADAGEECNHAYQYSVQTLLDVPTPMTEQHDAGPGFGQFCGVMPYPDDPRLEEENGPRPTTSD